MTCLFFFFNPTIGDDHLAKMSVAIITKSNSPVVETEWLGGIQGILIFRGTSASVSLTDGPSVLC